MMTHVSAGKEEREVTCHQETRDHRCDVRSGRCHGDHRSSRQCQILLGQRQRTRHGISQLFVLIH